MNHFWRGYVRGMVALWVLMLVLALANAIFG